MNHITCSALNLEKITKLSAGAKWSAYEITKKEPRNSFTNDVNREYKLGMRVQTQAFALKNNHKCHACNSRFTMHDG